MPDWLLDLWPHIISVIGFSVAVIASGHALLFKRDVRATIGWAGIIWLVPFFGAAFYYLLGINRIRRRARALRGTKTRYHLPPSVRPLAAGELGQGMSTNAGHLGELSRLVGEVTTRPLLSGNQVTPLVNGDEAYPAMLQAIKQAEQSVSLVTYIFDNDQAGRQFVDALAQARSRGVEVRVLIDAAGIRYSLSPVDRLLRKRKVRAARFMSAWLSRRAAYFNLRNHRKIMVVDGQIGFAGGINIRRGNQLTEKPRHPIQDIHFRLEGPVVAHLQEVFAEDWEFTTGESLKGEPWFPDLDRVGQTAARGIADGPDEDFEQIRWSLLGAIACARTSIRIVTPYFLPDQTLMTGLNVAAMRGVQVDVVLPEKGNLRVVQWATWAQLLQIVERGCRVWLTPEPFDHSKLMVVDGQWLLLGSANWDPRSLRLNFEFGVECYDPQLATAVAKLIDRKIDGAQLLCQADLKKRSLPVRLRDGLARVLTPYL